jgi:hypothetical protein
MAAVDKVKEAVKKVLGVEAKGVVILNGYWLKCLGPDQLLFLPRISV